MNEQQIQSRFGPALKRLDGDVELLCEMAAITAPDCAAVIARVSQAMSESDAEEAARALHKLKGMLSTFDTDGAVLEIQDILDQTRRGRLKEASVSFRERQG